MRRPSRVLAAVLAAGLATAGLVAVATTPALAATPQIDVHLLDPLMTDPVSIEVDVLDAAGTPLAFTGTITLSVARTKAATAVAGTGAALAAIPTSALTGGDALMTARITAGGTTRTVSVPAFTTVQPSLEVAGFGCIAVTAKGATVRWAVTRLNGTPIATPATRDRVLRLPYVASTAGLGIMQDTAGAPLRTSGRMLVLSGTRTVATVAVPRAARKLLFGVPWNGRTGGRVVPGTYTARLTLLDGVGRTTVAEQRVDVVASGAGSCG